MPTWEAQAVAYMARAETLYEDKAYLEYRGFNEIEVLLKMADIALRLGAER